MGRLIDADKTMESMQYYHDDCAKTSEYTRLGFETAIEVIKDAPTVEAIPKADYETRLKSDMVAMLTEIQLEIKEMDSRELVCDFASPWCIDRDVVIEVIQKEINELKGEKNVDNV